MNETPFFYVVVTGFNCEDYVRSCFESLLKQTYTNWKAVFVSDGSTDKTAEIMQELSTTDERLKIHIHKTNLGAAFHRYHVIHSPDVPDDAVICLLGMDDELLPNALEVVARKYAEGKWMTYGNWINQRGVMLPKGFIDFPDSILQFRDFRKVTYRSTALNTFYKFLFKQIPVKDFMINGKWIDSTTESEVMFSCLEMAGRNRIGVIYTPIYFYRERLPNGTLRRLGREYKYELLKVITGRDKRPLYENL